MTELQKEKTPLLVIAGPTAVGKTALSLALAERFNGEIVSADSMQVYRGMDIGTAKATAEERARIPHHLIDICDPTEEFAVADYAALAKKAIADIRSRGRLPILAGGTGFYIQAVLKNIDFAEEGGRDEAYRAELAEFAAREGNAALHARLEELDPAAAAAIHPNNVKRVIRALEYFRETGERISELNERQKQLPSPYRVLYLFLDMPREALYARIRLRVDKMIEDGLEEEVERLRAKGCRRGMVAMQALGYKELLEYREGLIGREEAIGKIKMESCHYAKRQQTWFKRETEAVRIDKSLLPEESALEALVMEMMLTRGIAEG